MSNSIRNLLVISALTISVPVTSAYAGDKDGIVAPMFSPVEVQAKKAIETSRTPALQFVDNARIVGPTMIVGPSMRPPSDQSKRKTKSKTTQWNPTAAKKLFQ